jgi:LmbE family N-acetylglucosaminyl deacetylase
MIRNVLAIAAHADDEALGCGGTLARHAAAGAAVSVVFLADGIGARGEDAAEAAARRAAASEAAAILGTRPPIFGGFPDNRMDSVPLLDVIAWLAKATQGIEPDIVYTHAGGDLNVDHRVAHQATLTLFRPQPQSSVRGIFAFEVPSSTEWSSAAIGAPFVPDRFVDIAATRDKKRRALEAYAAEMRPFPHARSFEAIEARDRWRGASVGLAAAEAFQTLRWIER